MTTLTAERAQARAGLETYVIKGGSDGAQRLRVMARALAPTTHAFLDRLGPLDGMTIVDAACGGGDLTFELARRAGDSGRLYGFDLDAEKLGHATDRAADLGLTRCAFLAQDVTKPWPVRGADLVYARFILTHLAEPEKLVEEAWSALKPGGILAVEDIDSDGKFCHPPSPSYQRIFDMYVAATRKRGCDPFIGRRLHEILEDAGFHSVQTGAVHPMGRGAHPAKETMRLTYHAVRDSFEAAGLATKPELEALGREIDAYTARPETLMAMPRVFQCWGVKR